MTSSSSLSRSISPSHPFKHSTSLLVVIPDKIDIEEESRLYDQICDDRSRPLPQSQAPSSRRAPHSPTRKGPPSVFSRDIWLGDNSGESRAFARDVAISGWTSVGDKLGGAYIVYDCVIRTKEGTTIHAHKRYSAFADLDEDLRRTLPYHLHHFIPTIPPKSPFARYRPAFLDRRRRQLQYWLSAVLLHPEIGACQAVRFWVMD
ncbi:Phox-like protein [Hygrophoropsis aurantiaca]|uniref:Phox-like protein n=1 Tax=Hygrophoropsis aurantiaca TaxID=72124 RepID=A0ACB8AAV6_9AGAM|nr:Phox-like protein [Hygrophoropsis aurantiaca]